MKATPLIVLLGVAVALPANDKPSAPPGPPDAPIATTEPTSTVAPAPVQTVDDEAPQFGVMFENWPSRPYIENYVELKYPEHNPDDDYYVVTEEQQKNAAKQYAEDIERQELTRKQIEASKIEYSPMLISARDCIGNLLTSILTSAGEKLRNQIGEERYDFLASLCQNPLVVPVGRTAYNILATEADEIVKRFIQRRERLNEVEVNKLSFSNYVAFVYYRVKYGDTIQNALNEAEKKAEEVKAELVKAELKQAELLKAELLKAELLKAELLKATEVENSTPTTSVETEDDLPEETKPTEEDDVDD